MSADFVLPVLPFAILPLGIGIWQRSRELAPRNWPQIDGTIVNSTINKEKIRQGYQYIPVIEYEYRYEDKTYNSSQRRVGNYVSGGRDDAESVGSRYPIGIPVKVFVNPDDPDNSVLEFGTTPISWLCIILGFLFTTLTTLALFGQ